MHSWPATRSCLVVLFLVAIPARARELIYTADGGSPTISGSVGALNFANATWVLTSTADPTGVQSGTLGGTQVYYLQSVVTLKITDNINGVTTMTLNDPVGESWGVVSGNLDFISTGSALAGFSPMSQGGSPWTSTSGGAGLLAGGTYGGSSGLYQNLASTGTWIGGEANFWLDFEVYSTSLGTLTLTNVNDMSSTGTFSITAVPEPSTILTAMLATVLLTARLRYHPENGKSFSGKRNFRASVSRHFCPLR